MTERENFMLLLENKTPEWVPMTWNVFGGCGTSLISHQGTPATGGRDFLGCKWITTPDTGAALPSPYEHILDDITKWKEVVIFPDLDAMDWENTSRIDLARMYPNGINNDRIRQANCGEGAFNRLEALMGIENAIYAMYDEPEAVFEFFNAYTDFRIKLMEKLVKYYGLELFVNGDDVCTADGLMITPDMYTQLIHPIEKRLAGAAINMGLIVDAHNCGNCMQVIDYMVATGARSWQPAQHMNDLVAVKEKYGDRLIINGGWDSVGPHNFDGATQEMVEAEVHRCLDTYAKGGGYVFFPVIVGSRHNPDAAQRLKWAVDECNRYGHEFYKNPANR